MRSDEEDEEEDYDDDEVRSYLFHHSSFPQNDVGAEGSEDVLDDGSGDNLIKWVAYNWLNDAT